MDHEDSITGAPDIQFNAIDTEGDCSREGPDGVLTYFGMHPTMGEDGNHRMSLAEASANYMDVILLIRESALVIMFQIR
jgi:hypothetical protein